MNRLSNIKNITPKSRKGAKTMNKEQKMEMAVRIINDMMERTNAMWIAPQDIHTYSWGWRNEDTISSDHDTQFFYMHKIDQLCHTLGLTYTVTVGENLDGKPTPYVQIF